MKRIFESHENETVSHFRILKTCKQDYAWFEAIFIPDFFDFQKLPVFLFRLINLHQHKTQNPQSKVFDSKAWLAAWISSFNLSKYLLDPCLNLPCGSAFKSLIIKHRHRNRFSVRLGKKYSGKSLARSEALSRNGDLDVFQDLIAEFNLKTCRSKADEIYKWCRKAGKRTDNSTNPPKVWILCKNWVQSEIIIHWALVCARLIRLEKTHTQSCHEILQQKS